VTSTRRTTRRTLAVILALTAWVAGSFAGAIGGGSAALAHPTFVIGRARAAYLPITDPGRPLFILLIGSDARPGTELENGIADSLHILGLNIAENRATLYGIPRDSWVPLASGGTNKINSSLPAGGPQATVDTVQNLTGIPIDYYVMTGFQEFTNFINDLGGVDIDNPYGFSGQNRSYPVGEQTLDGASALAFSRERHSLPRGDFHRSWNQGIVLQGLLQQFRGDFADDEASLYGWLGDGLREVQSEVPMQETIDLAMAVSRMREARVTNLVALGGTDTVDGMSIVLLSSANDALWNDMASDGFILEKDIPADAQPGL
jgi:LCP family protein required for cell wall assembly